MIVGPPEDVFVKYETYVRDFIDRAQLAASYFNWANWWLGRRSEFTVTSWYRDPATNARVGGNARSWHLIGAAIDLVVPDEQKRALLWAARLAGLQAVDEGDHVHLEPSGPSPVRG